jgi:ribonuclease E
LPNLSQRARTRTARKCPPRKSAEPVTRDNSVQAESTGAPVAYERRGPRQNDRPRPPRRRQYKIQEVIKRRQIMLVQVVKEERGNKGASLTTFLSLAGRYCVLMPNTPRGGGISRKITSATDRKRLKSAAQSLELPEGMGLIIRTAGANRTKLEIKRDYEYLLRLWDTVRELTLKSNAPRLVYEEGSLIKRVIAISTARTFPKSSSTAMPVTATPKDFMRMLMPSHAKNVKPYKEALPLFQSFHVESQLDAMFSPSVNLRSGGYIVINQTEALVSIDVNSAKRRASIRSKRPPPKTNLEAGR